MGLKYSQSKYGIFKYGASEQGFQFKIQISDSAGNVLALLNNQVKDLTWEYDLIGGCGNFSMTLKRAYDVLTNLTASDYASIYDFQLFITPSFGGSTTLYYRGFIESVRPSLLDGEEVVVSGTGYGKRLQQIQIQNGSGAPKTYTARTVTQLVQDIHANFLAANTVITLGTVDTFSTNVASINFNGTAEEALDKLASFVDAEWGVDRNLNLYFVARSLVAGYRYRIGKEIGSIDDEFDYSDIVNRVYIEGGDIAGVPYRYVKSDAGSIAIYGLKEKRMSNSSVIDSTVADKLASSILSKYSTFQRNTRITLPFNIALIESAVPIPPAVVVPVSVPLKVQYGGFKYGTGAGTGKYCGDTLYKFNNIRYSLKDASLYTEIEFNEGKPDITGELETLFFELEQERQGAGV